MNKITELWAQIFPPASPKRRKILRRTRKERIFRWLEIPVAMFWMQLVFEIATVGKLGASYLFFGTLFVLIFGFIFEFILSWIPKKSIYTKVKGLLLAIPTVIVIVMYFVFCKFNTFYDLKTIFGGAGGALGDFGGSIMAMVLSFDGILHIILFILPLLIHCIIGCRIDRKLCKTRREERVNGAGTIIVLSIIVAISLHVFPNAWTAYKTTYTFSNAIDKFGLYESILLDAIRGTDTSINFEPVTPVATTEAETTEAETEDATADETDTAAETTAPVVYGENKLNIDFTALANSTSDSTLQSLDEYVAAQTASKKNAYTGKFAGKNLIFITAEAFSAQAIDPDLTPTLYRMATKGFQFTDYYQPESTGTTGGEYSNVFGMLPVDSGLSFKQAANNLNIMTMGWQLNLKNYWGKAYHNHKYDFYDRNITHITLGYSNGFMGYGNGMEQYVTYQWPESDLEMIQGTLTEYINEDHFNIYYMSVSGHSDYTFATNAMSRKHQDEVADLDCSERVKAYLAANIELNDAMEYLINALEEAGKADDTVIVIGADHFPYGLDDSESLNMPYLAELYGVDSITDYLMRDQNRLIIWSGCLEDEDPVEISTPTYSVDILPTLMNLFGIDFDSRLLPGRDVFADNKDPLVMDTNYDWLTEYGKYVYASNTFTPVDENNLPDGYSDWDSYVKDMKVLVRNKMQYSSGVLLHDYFRHVFGDTGEISYSPVNN